MAKGYTFRFQIAIQPLVAISQSLQFLQSSPGLVRLPLLPQHIGRVGQRQDIAGSLLHLTCCHSFRFRHVTQRPFQESDDVFEVSFTEQISQIIFFNTLLLALNGSQCGFQSVDITRKQKGRETVNNNKITSCLLQHICNTNYNIKYEICTVYLIEKCLFVYIVVH